MYSFAGAEEHIHKTVSPNNADMLALISYTREFIKKYEHMSLRTFNSFAFMSDYTELLDRYIKQKTGKQLSIGFVQDFSTDPKCQIKVVFNFRVRTGSKCMDGMKNLRKAFEERMGAIAVGTQTEFTERDWFIEVCLSGAHRSGEGNSPVANGQGLDPSADENVCVDCRYDWCPVKVDDEGQRISNEPIENDDFKSTVLRSIEVDDQNTGNENGNLVHEDIDCGINNREGLDSTEVGALNAESEVVIIDPVDTSNGNINNDNTTEVLEQWIVENQPQNAETMTDNPVLVDFAVQAEIECPNCSHQNQSSNYKVARVAADTSTTVSPVEESNVNNSDEDRAPVFDLGLSELCDNEDDSAIYSEATSSVTNIFAPPQNQSDEIQVDEASDSDISSMTSEMQNRDRL